MSCILWIHCNKCFVDYKTQKQYYITQCKHIICVSCQKKIDHERRCPVCNGTTSFDLLNKNSPQNIIQLFDTNIENVPLGRVADVGFQMENRDEAIKNSRDKYQKVKSMYMELMGKYTKMKNDMEQPGSCYRPAPYYGMETPMNPIQRNVANISSIGRNSMQGYASNSPVAPIHMPNYHMQRNQMPTHNRRQYPPNNSIASSSYTLSDLMGRRIYK